MLDNKVGPLLEIQESRSTDYFSNSNLKTSEFTFQNTIAENSLDILCFLVMPSHKWIDINVLVMRLFTEMMHSAMMSIDTKTPKASV